MWALLVGTAVWEQGLAVTKRLVGCEAWAETVGAERSVTSKRGGGGHPSSRACLTLHQLVGSWGVANYNCVPGDLGTSALFRAPLDPPRAWVCLQRDVPPMNALGGM